MKTTSHRLIGLLSALVGITPIIAWTLPATTLPVGVAFAAGDGADETQQCDDLLRQARKAMNENHLQLADSFISRAEQLNPKYSIFHMGDTPTKARADLNRRLGIRTTAEDRAGSAYASAKPASDKTADGLPQNPFAARQDGGAANDIAAAPVAGDPAGTTRLPPVGAASSPAPWNNVAAGGAYPSTQASSSAYPSTQASVSGYPSTQASVSGYPSTQSPPLQIAPINAGAMPVNPKAESDTLLCGARRALAVGDVQRAAMLSDKAKQLQLQYGPMDDSPARIDALVARYKLMNAPGTNRESEGYRKQYAQVLMEESEGLLRWREFDEAERLAGEAKQQPVQYNPIETHPDSLLQRIAAERRQANQLAGQPANAPNGGGESRLDLVRVQAGAIETPATGRAGFASGNKQQALDLTRQARAALAQGDFRTAEQLALRADGLAPDSVFTPLEDRPSLVLLEIQRNRAVGNSGVVQAGVELAVDNHGAVQNQAVRSVYDPGNDPTRVLPAAGEEIAAPHPQSVTNPRGGAPAQLPGDAGAGDPNMVNDGAPPAVQAFRRGEQALTAGHHDEAMELFRQAYAHQDQLDVQSRQRLQDHLQMMTMPAPLPRGGDGMLEGAAARQQMVARQLSADVSQAQTAAKSMQQKDPKGALELLQKARINVAANMELDPQSRQVLLRRVDGSILETQQYIQKNLAQIQLNEQNQKVHDEVTQRQKYRVEVQEKLAAMVDEYNKLIEERRYGEAKKLASIAKEMDPENPVVVQMDRESKALYREAMDNQINGEKEDAIVGAFEDNNRAAIPFNDEIKFPEVKKWKDLTGSRQKFAADAQRHRSPGDLEIEQKLTTPVSLKFKNAPLSEVLNYLGKVTNVNLFIDPQGLQAEGVTPDAAVTIDLSRDIQLKSALALILDPLHLSYVIKNEVLNITSEDKRHGQVYTQSYQVADLVIPIPNFAPDGREGINAALREGYARLGYGGSSAGAFGAGAMPVVAVASDSGTKTSAMLNPSIAAQVRTLGLPGTGQVQSGQPQPSGYGPGGLKGGSQADFDSLIELITSTIAPTTWTESGGSGSIAPFETNLTLVVSQTQEVHEQIADLLQQLRRLQDLQVTIEVRFITLSDNFFEEIGVNFNFNIPSQTSGVTAIGSQHIPSQVVGDLNGNAVPGAVPGNGTVANPAPPIEFRQGSFNAATVPTFPGLTLDSTPTTFGFTILSDIEAFFLIQAFQGDSRSNVLQAPKVTLFNGQQAFVSDTSQRPFVTSVIPVVGDFAAAQQPVITVLSEGTSLTVQAVVSPDRRFVRLTVVPFFSQIGDVQEFQFTGSQTTTSSSANAANTGTGSSSSSAGGTVTTDGTTVQLPTFNFVTVTTTVSVPDGGTVLLGGIKRLSEGRNENGVPILSKIPYINRLFKNVGIGRTTSSLMMMVTPRIIIQEEEEQRLLGGEAQ